MRIAIVNDMLMAVEAMRRAVVSAGRHQVAWIALDGIDAVEKCAGDTPDLILMDLIMPRMDGIEATRRIMANTPCAIVIVTADVHNNSSKVFEAMGAGALDAVNTPVMEDADGKGDRARFAHDPIHVKKGVPAAVVSGFSLIVTFLRSCRRVGAGRP